MGAGRVVGVRAPLILELADGSLVQPSAIGAYASSAVAARAATFALERLAIGKEARLTSDGARAERHGRALAQVVIEDAQEPWLQRALVREGQAIVDTWASNRSCAGALLAAEAEARAAQRGLWSDPANAIVDAGNAEAAVERFAIVEGTVVAAAKVRGRIYLNFGDDWREDFTVRIEPAAARLFAREQVDPLGWEGARVRVRGFVAWRAGPEIEATHPEMIEVLEVANGE